MICSTHDCTASAAFDVHWPGKTSQMCPPCAERAKGIAAHMGFDLTVVSIEKPALHIIHVKVGK